MKRLDDKQAHYMSRLIRTLALFGSFIAFGICRSIQGPTLLELQKQVQVDTSTFQIVFLLGAITFPAGNVLAGFLFEKLPPSFLLFIATLILSLSTSFIPFSPNINILAAASGAAEFALGLLDTGANVYCLQLWGDKSGPYFNALHLSQGLGFLLAPLLSESVLANMQDVPNLMEDIEAFNVTAIVEDVIKIHVQHLEHALTPVQTLYLAVGFITFLIALSFIPGIAPDMRIGSYEFPDEEQSESGHNTHNPRLEYWSVGLVLTMMTAYFVISNGITFAYGSFLTTYVVKSSLAMTASEGARVTSVYYAAQIIMRGINIVLVTRLKRISLVLLFISLVACGTIVLFSWDAMYGVYVGSAIVGLGSGSLFPMGLLWLQGHMELSGKITALFCLATTVGAQVFRFPEAAFIETVPRVHLYLLAASISATIILFIGAFLAMQWRLKLLKEKEARFMKIKSTFDNFAKGMVEI